jgi:cyclopropane fatty-acyl-phospholipid synthase-like methyltransferase
VCKKEVQNLFRRILFQYMYFRQPPWDTGISPPELLEFIQTHQPGRAIDIGCGTGTNLITLANSGWKVTGVDFAPRAIRIARRKLRHARVQANLLIQDVTKLRGITGLFDFALDLGCFHGLSQAGKPKYLEGLDRILAPGGFWLMYGFLKSDPRHTRSGLLEEDINQISSHLTLVWRRDGFDNGAKPSAWFLYQKHNTL